MKLDNGRIEVEIDDVHGCFRAVRHIALGIDLIAQPGLGENFRLLVPHPDLRANYVLGSEQRPTSASASADGTTATLRFESLTSTVGELPIIVEMEVRLKDDDLAVELHLENHSDLVVEEATVLLGGMDGPDTEAWRLHYANAFGSGQEWSVFNEFPGSYLGPAKPRWIGAYNTQLSMPWVDLYDAHRRHGVVVASLSDGPSEICAALAELTPSTVYRGRGDYLSAQRWPDRDGVTPIGLALGWTHFPFLRPDHQWSSPTVIWHFHTGTWWAAADWYREWFIAHHPEYLGRPTSWLSTRDAWQSTIISYPDDVIGYRYADLPRLAADAKQVGISVLQIDGWDVGGIDRNYPDYSPDPRLGTPDDLKRAIAECRDIGVEVLLFTNLQWAHIDTETYQKEWHKYAVRDPRGDVRNTIGWEYNTTLGLMRQTEPRMALMNPSHQRFHDHLVEQLTGVIHLGASGMQIDKLGMLSAIDYAAPAGTSPQSSVMEGILDVLRTLTTASARIDPNFAFAGESHWDRSLPYIEASYSRYFLSDHLPTLSHAFPEFRQTVCVTGDCDFGLVNNAIRFGHIINIEASCLHGSVSDLPTLSPYLAEVLRIRKHLTDVLWDSRLVEPMDVSVDGGVLIGRHRGADGLRNALVVNHFERKDVEVTVNIDSQRTVEVWQPFTAPTKYRLPLNLTVPKNEVAILVW